MDILKRFASKVAIGADGCHDWQSTLHRDGYGKFWFNGMQIAAHRMAYLLYCGEIPDEAWVLHHCDNRKCVNPEHLYIGDAAQNSQDRSKRLRYACRKLSAEDVNNIRDSYAEGSLSQTDLADLYGVRQCHVSRIVRCEQRTMK